MQKNTNKKVDIAVIGGGASGLMAAIAAARQGVFVTVLDRMPRVGKKILVTGNGRCNFSNRHISSSSYNGSSPAFIDTVLDQFDLTQTLNVFETMGLAWIEEPGTGRLFPRSKQASSILDLLRLEAQKLSVSEKCDSTVTRLESKNGQFHAHLKDGETLRSNRVVLATGGRAVPNLGSNGSGYKIAEQMGHSIIHPFPALVQLVGQSPWKQALKGVKCEAELLLFCNKQIIKREKGEIQFTQDGLSGIPALRLARPIHSLFNSNKQPGVSLNINFFPDYDQSSVRELLEKRLSLFQDFPIHQALISLVNKRLIPVFLKSASINNDILCSELHEKKTDQLHSAMTSLAFPVTGSRSWSDAQVTAGGIDTAEIDAESLESKKQTGLYFAGELIDVDGDSGGYNLQWAWSSGWVAGTRAASSIH